MNLLRVNITSPGVNFIISLFFSLSVFLPAFENKWHCQAENQTPRAVNKNIALKMNAIVIIAQQTKASIFHLF